MAVAYRDLEILAGNTVEFVVDVEGGPASLTGYVGSMAIRAQRADQAFLAAVAAEHITINASTRQVTVRIPGSVTATYTWRRGVYDLVITGPSGDPWCLVEGRVTSAPLVTRA